MKKFLSKDFLLQNDIAQELYHDCAKQMPIIDYHCHLPPAEIAENRKFENLTKIWLDGDHYKWRAMRTLGIDEKFISGEASDLEKFKKWAFTVPRTLRNPLYHWTQMELKNYFGIEELLSPDNAESIFYQTEEMLQTEDFTSRNLLRYMDVELVCTSDDPVDSLAEHKQIKNSGFEIQVLPTFRPDKAYSFEDPTAYNNYLSKLEEASGISINSFEALLAALENRVAYFDQHGCRLSDHGIPHLYFSPSTSSELEQWFGKVRKGKKLEKDKIHSLKYHILLELGKMYHDHGWVQQYHLGALRNANERMYKKMGPDAGFDSIGDYDQAERLAKFLNELDKTNQLAKTVLYNVNPKDSTVMATMAGNFNDGSIKGKVQYGPAWWFLDQKDGLEEQINILSNMGLISCFIGMLTDSRSFLSYPRHEYFRRVLCNLFGNDVENGEVPHNMDLLKSTIADICYYNAKEYFNVEMKKKVS